MNTTEISDTYSKIIYKEPGLKEELDNIANSIGIQARQIKWSEHLVPLMFVEPQIEELSNVADTTQIRKIMNLIRAGYKQKPIIYDLRNKVVRSGHNDLIAYHMLGIKDIPVVGYTN